MQNSVEWYENVSTLFSLKKNPSSFHFLTYNRNDKLIMNRAFILDEIFNFVDKYVGVNQILSGKPFTMEC